MNAFVLKIIALTTMIIDHMGAIMPENFGVEFRVVGRVAFPIYVFLVAEGFRHTSSPFKFLARLGIFAIISEPVFDLALFGEINFLANTNIFYTLFLGGAAIISYQRVRDALTARCDELWRADRHKAELISSAAPAVAFLPGLGFMFVAQLLSTDYGGYGVFFILCMYAIKAARFRLAAMVALCLWQHIDIISFALEGYIHVIPTLYLLAVPATLVPVVLVALYNGRRGIGWKWFFYASYPAHLGVLLLVSSWLNSPVLS